MKNRTIRHNFVGTAGGERASERGRLTVQRPDARSPPEICRVAVKRFGEQADTLCDFWFRISARTETVSEVVDAAAGQVQRKAVQHRLRQQFSV